MSVFTWFNSALQNCQSVGTVMDMTQIHKGNHKDIMLALGLGALGVRGLTGDFQGSSGFRLWLQLMHCTYLLTLSEYF